MKRVKSILSVFIVSAFGFFGSAHGQNIGQILQTIKNTAQTVEGVVRSVKNSGEQQNNQSAPQNTPQQNDQNYNAPNGAGTVIGKHYYEYNKGDKDYEGGMSIRYMDNGQAVIDINTVTVVDEANGNVYSCELSETGKVVGNVIEVNRTDREMDQKIHFRITLNNNIANIDIAEDDSGSIGFCGAGGGFVGTYTFAEQNNLRIGALKEAHTRQRGCDYYFDANRTQKAAVYDAEKGRGVIYGDNNQNTEFQMEDTVFNLDGYDRELKQDSYEVQNIPVPEGYFIFRKYLYDGYSLFLMHKDDGAQGNAQNGEAVLFVERNRNVQEIPLYFYCNN